MAGWRETAILYLIFSVVLSLTVSLVNAMAPVPILGVQSSPLSQFVITEADIAELRGEYNNPNPILGIIIPSQVLGFLTPVITGVGFLAKILFTIFLSWSLVIQSAVVAVLPPGEFTDIFSNFIVIPILVFQVLAFLVLAREVKETIPFAG